MGRLGRCRASASIVCRSRIASDGTFSIHRAYEALIRGAIAWDAEKLDASETALREAEEGFRVSGDAAGLFLVAATRVKAAIAQERRGEAGAILGNLLSHPLLPSFPANACTLLACRIRLGICADDRHAVEKSLVDYEACPAWKHSLAVDLDVYRRLARWHGDHQRWQEAEPACRKALAAVQTISEALGDMEDQERFLARQAVCVQEATNCLEQLGKVTEAEELRTRLSSPEGLKRHREENRRCRNLRYHRAGLVLILIDLFSWLGSPLSSSRWPRARGIAN